MEKSFRKFSIRPKNTSFELDNDDADSIYQQKVKRFKQDTQHRKSLVVWMMFVVSVWLGAVLLIVCFSSRLSIADNVLITLLATTTINVLGLANIILKGMFPKISRLKTKKKNQPNNPLPW